MTTVAVTPATTRDIPAIAAVMAANIDEHSLYQQPEWEIARHLDQFLVARSAEGAVAGCLQVLLHRKDCVEILAVAVAPVAQGIGVGRALMRAGIARACQLTDRTVFLGTRKADYFVRFGFEEVGQWSLPLGVLISKIPKVFRQRIGRWLPGFFGSRVFMVLRRIEPVDPQ